MNNSITLLPINGNVILRLPAVIAKTGLPKSTIYLRMSQGIFPCQIRLGPRTVGWLVSDIEHWLAHCVHETNQAA